MAYERTVWENGTTPINAENLNNMEEGILQAQNFIGTNPITSEANDTPEKWIVLGTGVAYISSSGLLKNQPKSAGFLETRYNGGAAVSQTFWTRDTDASNTPKCYLRYGSTNSGWYNNGKWLEILDTTNTLDRIVARGTNNNFTYVQYESGRYEAWREVSNITPSSMTATGSNYYAAVTLCDVPSWSKSVDYVNVSLETSQYAWVSRGYVESGSVKMSVLRSSSTPPSMKAQILLKGTYK